MNQTKNIVRDMKKGSAPKNIQEVSKRKRSKKYSQRRKRQWGKDSSSSGSSSNSSSSRSSSRRSCRGSSRSKEVGRVGTVLPTKRRFLAATLGEGGPYHPPWWQRQSKEDSSCGNCGKTRSGVVGVLEALVTAGVVATIKKPGGRSTSPAMQIKCGQRWATSFLDCLNWECPTSELAPHSEAISLLGSYQD